MSVTGTAMLVAGLLLLVLVVLDLTRVLGMINPVVLGVSLPVIVNAPLAWFVAVDHWGRIPTYLKRHGATIFHGEQQAWGSIEQNAADVAARIDAVVRVSGADRINIIAHSRGGIDARCAISTHGKGVRVASLTTMNTPHHDVRFADTATRLKLPVYLRLAAASSAPRPGGASRTAIWWT